MSDAGRSRRRDDVVAEVGGRVDEVHVTLALYGETLDPDEVSRRLGCAPTSAFRKGDSERPSGRKGRPYPHGAWLLTLEDKAPVEVDALVTQLLGRLPAEPAFWSDLRRDYRVRIWIALYTTAWNRGFTLRPRTTELVALTGAELVFDWYCEGDDAGPEG